jgi:2'-5' RNA ligase
MIKRSNIALIPTQANQQIIDCASHFTEIANNYLLGKQSLPHVTLYQLNGNDHDIPDIIKKLSAIQTIKSIDLSFETFSCISFDQKVHWASLMPDKIAVLMQWHKQIAECMNQPIKPTYDPHMTLMNTKQHDYELLVDAVKLQYKAIKDKFILSIGESDEIGQYLKVIHRFDNEQ